MLKHISASTLLLAWISSAACDRGIDSNITGPSSESGGGAALKVEPSMNLTAASLTARLSGRTPCPYFHPFLASTNLVVRADGGFRLTEIAMSFRDQFGNTGPQVTLPAPVPIQQFGSELASARRTFTFPLDLAYGCGTGRSGTIILIVSGQDGRGVRNSTELRATVR
jgi:hypothetical protein